MKNKVVFKMKLKKRKCLAVILVLTLLLSMMPSNLFLKAEKAVAASSAPTGASISSSDSYCDFYANGTPITIEASIPGDAEKGDVPGYVEPTAANCTAYIVWSMSGKKYYIGTGRRWYIGSGSYAYCRIFGGSTSGLTSNTSITMNGGTVFNLYGGNYNSNLTGNTSIDIKGGTINIIFGGCVGSTGSVNGDTVITVDNATVDVAIYGGNGTDYNSSVSNTTVNIKGGNIKNVWGGSGIGSVTGNATVNVSGGTCDYILGGGLNWNVDGDATVNISGGTNNTIYGGGAYGTVLGDATVNVSGGTNNTIYGGGLYKDVLGDATINITGGAISNNIDKGLLDANSKCNLYISGGNVSGTIQSGLTPMVSATNNTPVVGYTLTVGAIGNGQAVSKLVTAVPVLGYSYGMNGVKTNASSQIKVYLPAGKTQAAVKADSTYYKGNITSDAATLASYTPTTITATSDSDNALTSATGSAKIILNSAISGLSNDDIVVSKNGVALTSGTDYTVSNISTTAPLITFTASAGLNHSSVVTVAIEKMDYDISSYPVTITNNIPVVAPGITTTSLSNATIGTAYSQTLVATGDAPITWAVTSGILPNGLTHYGNTIIGTPTVAGSFTFGMTALNAGGVDTHQFTITVDPIKVTSLDLTGLVITPVKGQTPSTTAINTSQYSGTVSWSPSTTKFEAGTTYTATVTLTPKTNYTFEGVSLNSFTCTGADSVSNVADSGTVSIVYPETAAKELNSITINDEPNTTTYSSGENFDPSGLSLTLHYDDGTTQVVTYSDATKASFGFNKSALTTNDTSVQITYGGKNVNQSITVNHVKVTLNNLSAFVTAPVKGQIPSTTAIDTTQYTGTVSWSPADARFEGGKVYTATVTLTAKAEYTFSGVAANSFTYTGATGVTNAANSGTVSISFPATAAKVLDSVTVKNAPTKTTYVSGDSFNPAGLALTLHYDDSTTADVNYSDATKADFSFNKTAVAVSDKEIQITYKGKSVSQAITVNEKAAAPVNTTPAYTTPASTTPTSTAPSPTNVLPTFTTQTIVNSNNSVALSGSMVSGISLNVVPIPTTDADYTGMKKLIGNNEVLGAFHVTVTGGSYQGNLGITFTVGNRYNLRNAIILHKKQNGTIETLSGMVKNGKVTVTVSELSPFVIMVQPAKSVPKTGDTTSNLPLIMVAIFSAIGFTAFFLNRKRKSKDAK